MPTSHDLEGVMKFLSRDEWRACFDEVLDNHLGPVLKAGDMEFEDITRIIGADWAVTAWGCAFEDFLTQEFDVEGGNIADDYLKRRGWKESAHSKAYIKALRTSIMSLYEVSEIVPGKSLMARDLLRGGEPIFVNEGTATKMLKQWDKIAARIVPVMDKNIFAGGLLPFTAKATDELFEALRQLFGKKNAKKLPTLTNNNLQIAAPLFTLSWLFDTVERKLKTPAIRNAQGEELVFYDVHFPLAGGVVQKDLVSRVKTIPGLSQENAKFWNWLEEKPTKGKGRPSATLTLDTIMDDGSRVLGTIELKGRFLHLSTSSAERAEKGIALIQHSLGSLVSTPLTERRTVAQIRADHPAQDQADATSALPDEMAEEIAHQFMNNHYREVLDQSVAMLDNKTPRQAAKSATGRKQVAQWLKYLENQSAQQHSPTDPIATYSFEWLWHELDIIDLRK